MWYFWYFCFCRIAIPPTIDSAVWSVHLVSGAVWFQYLLWGVGLLASVLLLVGYRTKLATVVLFILTTSTHKRNEFLVTQEGRCSDNV